MTATTDRIQHTRTGTARRVDGKATAAKIISAAHELLQSGGAADFSMRNVADKAGVKLANLQYYFPKKEALIRALMDYVASRYDARYGEQLGQVANTPLSHLKAVIRLNLKDIASPETRHFFIQFWPLLGVADNYSGELLARFYTVQKKQFADRVAAINPLLSADDVVHRAELIAAIFEGLMVTVDTESVDSDSLAALIEQQVLAIATAPASGAE